MYSLFDEIQTWWSLTCAKSPFNSRVSVWQYRVRWSHGFCPNCMHAWQQVATTHCAASHALYRLYIPSPFLCNLSMHACSSHACSLSMPCMAIHHAGHDVIIYRQRCFALWQVVCLSCMLATSKVLCILTNRHRVNWPTCIWMLCLETRIPHFPVTVYNKHIYTCKYAKTWTKFQHACHSKPLKGRAVHACNSWVGNIAQESCSVYRPIG